MRDLFLCNYTDTVQERGREGERDMQKKWMESACSASTDNNLTDYISSPESLKQKRVKVEMLTCP